MDNKNNTTLFVPIQINGGDNNNVPVNLLDRELFVIKNGTLYVGIENEGNITIGPVKGNVIPNATIANPTLESPKITNGLFVDGTVTITEKQLNSLPDKEKQDGRVYFVDTN